MPYDLLTIFCEDARDASFAAARVPRRASMRRLFLFLGDKPEAQEIAWMGGNDIHIHLDRVLEIPTCEQIATRAAITFTDSNAWNLLFCWADSPPEDAELDEARQALQQFERHMRRVNVWGCAREHIVLYGFEAAYRGESFTAGSLTDAPQAVSKEASLMLPASELEIGKALRGEPVEMNVLIAAIAESAPMQSLGLHTSVFEKGERHRPALEKLLTYAEFMDADNPVTMILGSNASVKTLQIVREKIPKTGSVVVLVDEDESPLLKEKPYRILSSTDGVKALLFKQAKAAPKPPADG